MVGRVFACIRLFRFSEGKNESLKVGSLAFTYATIAEKDRFWLKQKNELEFRIEEFQVQATDLEVKCGIEASVFGQILCKNLRVLSKNLLTFYSKTKMFK